MMQNKIYLYHHNFEADLSKGDDIYNKDSSKLKYNIKRLFKEDAEVNSNPEYQRLVQGESY